MEIKECSLPLILVSKEAIVLSTVGSTSVVKDSTKCIAMKQDGKKATKKSMKI